MFRRRKPLTFAAKVQEFFWPHSGWVRSSKYLLYRIERIPGSPWSIAAGFACGAAASFTPFVGFHILLSMIIAKIMRASALSAAIGTVVGNPWTFPFIWMSIFHLGHFILLDGETTEKALNFASLFKNLSQSVIELDAERFVGEVWPVWFPMLVGSLPLVIAVWFVFYFPMYRFISDYQLKKAKNKERVALLRQEILEEEEQKLREKHEKMQKELALKFEKAQEKLERKIEKQIEKQQQKFDKHKLRLEAKINADKASIEAASEKLKKALDFGKNKQE